MGQELTETMLPARHRHTQLKLSHDLTLYGKVLQKLSHDLTLYGKVLQSQIAYWLTPPAPSFIDVRLKFQAGLAKRLQVGLIISPVKFVKNSADSSAKEINMKLRPFALSLAVSLAASTFAFGQVTGSVKLDGKAPEPKKIDMASVKECAAQHPDPPMDESVVADDKGGLANVIVSVTPADGQALPGDAPADPAVLDQQGCMYTPHVLALMAGQKLVVKNSDPFMHNVHSLSEVNPAFNQAQPNKDEQGLQIENLKSPEYFHIKCDVHGWMSAYVGVFEHPYFAVSGDDGKYSFKADQLPDGEYTLTAWHEKYGKQEQKVNVAGGKATADFTFKAEAAQANPAPLAEVKLASSIMNKDECKDGSCCEVTRESLLKTASATPAKEAPKTN
jgi:hypothetical protein